MAAKDWIERTVDTTGRPCPLRQIPCPGTRKECAFWLDEILAQGATTALQGGCAVLYQYTLLHEVVLESVRTQASINTATTEIQRTNGEIQKTGAVWAGLLRLAAAPRDPRVLAP